MHRCPICAASDTPGWIDDGDGGEMACPGCTINGQLHGSGYLQEDGTPVPIEEAPEDLGTIVTHMCPRCHFRNAIVGWDHLVMFICRRCGQAVDVWADRVH